MPSNVINSFMAGRQVRNDQQDRDLAAQDRQRAEHLRNAQRRINMLMAPNGGALGGDQGGNPVSQPQPNAMQSPTAAPQGQMPAAPMAQAAPAQPMSNRAQAEQIGRRNPELMAQFGQMDQAARDRSAAAMSAIQRVVNSLRGVPVEQRAGAIRAAAPQLFAVGARPEHLAEYEAILSDPTRSDAAIESISSGVLDAQDTFAAFAPKTQNNNEVFSRFQNGQQVLGAQTPGAIAADRVAETTAGSGRISANASMMNAGTAATREGRLASAPQGPQWRNVDAAEAQREGLGSGVWQVNESTGQYSRRASDDRPNYNANESIAATFAARMSQSSDDMQRLVSEGYEVTDLSARLPYRALDQQQRQWRQAQSNWVRANLRKESGAVIGDNEMADEIANYFPQPGDGPDILAQKARARATAERGMIGSSGGAYEDYFPEYGNAPQQPDVPAGGTQDIPNISSDADYDALPSGAEFIAPDGTRRRKP